MERFLLQVDAGYQADKNYEMQSSVDPLLGGAGCVTQILGLHLNE